MEGIDGAAGSRSTHGHMQISHHSHTMYPPQLCWHLQGRVMSISGCPLCSSWLSFQLMWRNGQEAHCNHLLKDGCSPQPATLQGFGKCSCVGNLAFFTCQHCFNFSVRNKAVSPRKSEAAKYSPPPQSMSYLEVHPLTLLATF